MKSPIEIAGEKTGTIHLSPALRTMYGPQHIPGLRCLEARGAFGHLLFQEIQGDDFSVWHCSFYLNHDDKLTLTWSLPVLRLWMALKCSFYFTSDNTGENVLHERGFRFDYFLTPCQTIRLRGKQSYSCVAVHFSHDFAREMAQCIPGGELFLQNVEKGEQTSPFPYVAGMDMLGAVEDILYCTYTSEFRRQYLSTKTLELLFLALERSTRARLSESGRLPELVVRRIYEAAQLITRHLARDYSLRDLGVLVGLSDYQLKRGFKTIYNLTAADYRHEIRMKKARLLLEETDRPIAGIASEVGYDHPFAFSSAFRKFFGCPPSIVRKGKRIRTN